MAKRGRFFAILCALIVCATLVSGCASSYAGYADENRKNVLSSVSVTIHGATSDEKYLIKDALLEMPKEVSVSIRCITVYKDNLSGHFGDSEAAHCHGNNQICFLRDYLCRGTVWHEAGHALKNYIPKEAVEEYGAIAQDVFGPDKYKTNENFPLNGILTTYGSTARNEDMAEWVRCVMTYCHSDGKINLYYGVLKTDTRYIRKLDWLLKWHFISQEQHNRIAPLLR